MDNNTVKAKKKISKDQFKESILSDYKLVCEVRECGAQGRRDVLSGKGSFGIFGDGKELAQIALAKVFRNGDFRAGYYRDQTLMTAIGQYSPKHMFSALYGDPDLDREPSSGSRQMMNHFGTRFLNEDADEEKITNVIEEIFAEKISDGQLDNAPITFSDIDKIKQSFQKSLEGLYHQRVMYPEIPEEE